jgi:hypothetical protein
MGEEVRWGEGRGGLVKNVNKETKKKDRDGEGYNAVIRRKKLRCETGWIWLGHQGRKHVGS